MTKTINQKAWEDLLAIETEAAEALRAAERAINEAVDALHRATERYLLARLSTFGTVEDAKSELINIAYSNRATWSGGPESATNIKEAAMRDAAITLLQNKSFERRIERARAALEKPE